MELISREACKDLMISKYRGNPTISIGKVLVTIDQVRTIESRPKGEWTEDKCSNCGYIDILKPYAWVEQNGEMIQVLAKNFCSNCGADMRGKE